MSAPSRGVVYFNIGTKCVERLAVSLHTLRKHWEGPVAIVNLGPAPENMDGIAERYGALLILGSRLPDRALVNKVHSLSLAPYDLNLFLDADTVVAGPLDPFLDALEAQNDHCIPSDPEVEGPVDFVWCNFCSWRSGGRKVGGRMEKWRGRGLVTDAELDAAKRDLPAINVGTFAFRRGAPFLARWLDLTKRGGEEGLWIPDEQAAQISLPTVPCRVVGPEWGVSVRYGAGVPDKRIIHYHGNKHNRSFPLCDLWRAARDEVSDDAARATLVIAVNRPYLALLRRNYETWASFRDKYPKLVIYNGIDPSELEEFLTGSYRLVEWDMPGVSPKEAMITSFVRLAPAEVRTPFWIKLDVDTVAAPDTELFGSDQWYAHDLVSHRWAYTKPGRWLRTLEEWGDRVMRWTPRVFTGEELEAADAQNRYGHPRIQSFVCLHRTSFTREVLGLLDADPGALPGGRMPVPSHDTLLWYAAARKGASIRRINAKRWGFSHGRKK